MNCLEISALHLKQTVRPINWIFIEGEGDGIESRLPFKSFLLYLRIDTRLLMRDLLMSHLSFFEMGYEDLLDQIVRLTVDHQERKRLFCFCSGKLNNQMVFKNVSFFHFRNWEFRQLTAELRCCWLDSGWFVALPPLWQNNKVKY